jgi:hypothetical protein
MPSFGMLRRVVLVENGVSEERTTIVKVASIGDVPSSTIVILMMMEVIRSSETSALARAARRNMPEDGIIHSHRRKNLKSNIISLMPKR